MAARARSGNASLWGVMAFLSVGVGLHGLSFLVLGFAHFGTELQANGFNQVSPYGLLTHAVAAGLALALGPFQFVPGLRAKRPKVHRWMGRTYVAACMVAGLAGGLIAPFTFAGPIAGAGFLLLALSWLGTTFLAWRRAVAREFAEHERWMIRSFALTFAAVTLRLYLIPVGVFGWAFAPAYVAIAWLCWVPNLIAAEIYIRARRPVRARAPAAA
jgi:uncharacterized membrane protein